MDSYHGSYLHTLDAKNRLSIPSEMRQATGEVFMLTRGFEECLNLYPADEWKLVEKELRSLRMTAKRARLYVRTMLATARKVVVDGHGRITIPKWHREFAGLEDEVLVNGALDHIEIWNPDRFAAYSDESDMSYEDVAEDVWKHVKGEPPTSDE